MTAQWEVFFCSQQFSARKESQHGKMTFVSFWIPCWVDADRGYSQPQYSCCPQAGLPASMGKEVWMNCDCGRLRCG